MSNRLTFVLNGERQQPVDLAPTTTLLTYLREHKRLIGSKEGCGEGDCGACTVILADLRAGRPRYRAVNSCILLLPMVHGRLVLTVEAVKGPEGELHPLQQALVELHGSQCGFCTPGFVMALYARYLDIKSDEDSRDEIPLEEVLAGNLCRCTGYGPILEAAKAAFDRRQPQWDMQRRARDAALLQEIREDAPLSLEAGEARWDAPHRAGELAEIYQRHQDAHLVAGATDIGLWLTKQLRTLPHLIDVSRVEELKQVELREKHLLMGAAVSYTEALEILSGHFPDFGALIRRIGSPQVRNSGTLGGNIANGSPIGDSMPALIALGATLVLRRGDARRELALEDYFLDYGQQDRQPGEFVERVEVPLLDDPQQLKCYKLSKRFDQDISSLLGCFNLEIVDGQVTSARIAFGGMAGIPKRAGHVEAALMGQPWRNESVQAALTAFEKDFQPLGDMRGGSDYRLGAAKNLLVKFFLETQPQESLARISELQEAPA